MTDAKLKSFVDRVKQLAEEQKAIGGNIADVCKSAKEAGFDPTTIRFVVREMMMDAEKKAERDQKRDMHLHALGLAVAAVESGEMSARQSAKIFGVGKSSIYKELSVRDVSADDREMVADDLGDPLLVIDKDRGRFRERIRTLAADIKPAVIEAIAPDPRTFDEITGPIPAHLRRIA